MDESRLEEYLKLCAQHERALSAYVFSLVNQRQDAEDIIQESRVVMWKRFESFEEGTNFKAWAKKIALHQILNYRRKNKRRPATGLDIEFIEKVAEEMNALEESEDLRSEALEDCLKRLPETQRQLVLWRYYEDLSIEEVAERANRTITASYRFLSRIRETLSGCIERRMA